MRDRVFIDTNIWVYSHLKQKDDRKSDIATSLLENLPTLVISTQVLSEYYSAMLKNKVPDHLIQENLEVMISVSEVQVIQISTIRLCHRLKINNGLSYWDSLIMASAIESNCQYLYSEDMQKNQIIDKQVQIINPFQ
ncbi:PIN domain-containing protein [Synechococcus sp. C9]|jgi:predicted nucleic acid-binding protein|uniref:PIN domain-containing protein n=1 Tax=Synechococcus sp. C9 TaxID=102119 RepID=UPI001FF39B6B|nr:PIN domain-containing protein [Synechococcus sp. C9]